MNNGNSHCFSFQITKIGKFMDIPAKLSLEQQFKLQVLRDEVKVLSKEQAQDYLIEVFRQMMVKDNLVKHLLKNA